VAFFDGGPADLPEWIAEVKELWLREELDAL
jgi:hypothetical protein